jgi:hypothetical protein
MRTKKKLHAEECESHLEKKQSGKAAPGYIGGIYVEISNVH